ncbi:PAS domain-containing sensor histidine kinase [Alphaproteobacteria bacterium]|nr:PAS domain-containing sensor histidine kinase [Alphaproteobacteria bacterium]
MAESYLGEHKRNTLNDCITISKIIDYHVESMFYLREIESDQFSQNIGFQLEDLCVLKGINSAILLDSSLEIIAHSKYSVALHFINIGNGELIRNVNEKNSMILDIEGNDDKNIIAISSFKTRNGDPMYLIIEKNVNSNIVSNAQNARNAYNEYYKLLENRGSLEIAFIFMFLIVGVLLLIVSIVVAIRYSWRIVRPISNLIDVSESIIGGDATARAKEGSSYEEISLLIKTFNEMVKQVHEKKEDLVKINTQLDERIKFTSSVLAGVSSGVIGIDNNAIYIWNNAAEKLLNKKIVFGEHISNLIPEIEDLILEACNKQFVEREIQYKKDNEYLLFSIKIENIEFSNNYCNRFVITFDDMTNVVMAQRKVAWTEVARRVAHEIKNPLTPIQLSAERLRRKYISQISTDSHIFSELVNTIIRQVGDIKRLIDDFNFFARLPEPILRVCNVYEIGKQAVFLMENATNGIELTFIHAKEKYETKADERLLHQSIVNLIQNSINALNTINKESKKIFVTIDETVGYVTVSVEDNGPGLPKERMESLATPYFTLTPKGTGLGLTIVKKIVQDHGGELLFEESKYGGAKVTMSVPYK